MWTVGHGFRWQSKVQQTTRLLFLEISQGGNQKHSNATFCMCICVSSVYLYNIYVCAAQTISWGYQSISTSASVPSSRIGRGAIAFLDYRMPRKVTIIIQVHLGAQQLGVKVQMDPRELLLLWRKNAPQIQFDPFLVSQWVIDWRTKNLVHRSCTNHLHPFHLKVIARASSDLPSSQRARRQQNLWILNEILKNPWIIYITTS